MNTDELISQYNPDDSGSRSKFREDVSDAISEGIKKTWLPSQHWNYSVGRFKTWLIAMIVAFWAGVWNTHVDQIRSFFSHVYQVANKLFYLDAWLGFALILMFGFVVTILPLWWIYKFFRGR
jgi:hypothetical protein